MAPKRRAAVRDKGGNEHSGQPVPLPSPCAVSSARPGGTTKGSKNKKGSSFNPARLVSGLGNLCERAASETRTPSSLPSTSAVALPFQAAAAAAAASSCPNAGHSLLEATAPLSEDERMEQEEHCEEAIHSVDTLNHIRTAASEVEPIELDESGVEVVDLTCETSESVVVDLTHNDSVVFVEENRQWQNQELRSQLLSDSCVLSSDDDGEPRGSNICVTSELPRELLEGGIANSGTSGTVSCPICMEGYSEIMHSGRLIMSTKCGHIFCSQCLRNSLRNASFCPTCRKKLNHKQYHPIYI